MRAGAAARPVRIHRYVRYQPLAGTAAVDRCPPLTCVLGVAAHVTIDAPTTATGTLTSSTVPLTADIDGNFHYDALTDGLLVSRYLFGITGNALAAGAIGSGATHTDPYAIARDLDDMQPLLDLDGNGHADALADGILLIRYLFGLRGTPLIAGTIGPGATCTTYAEIESAIQKLLPYPWNPSS